MDWLKGKKTYIIAVLMIVVGVVKVATGDMSLMTMLGSEHIQTILEGFGLATIRAGVAKVK